jgi:outer membrane protein OmpA-like peptidoglycan-associated protein
MRHLRTLAVLVLGGSLATGGCNLVPGGSPPPPLPPVMMAPVAPAYIQGDLIGGRAARIRKARAAGRKLLTAGAVADYVNRQEIDLRRQTAGTGVDVLRSGELLLLRLPATGTFDVGQSAIRPQAMSTLAEIGLTLKRFDQTLVDVLGHSDSTGTPASNLTLSQKRADAVAAQLRARGVVAGRIGTKGYAAAYPIADNASESGRALNRRVEIKLVPLR